MSSHHSSGAFRYSSIMTDASLGEKYPIFFFFLFWLTLLDEYQSEAACVPKSNRVLEKSPSGCIPIPLSLLITDMNRDAGLA